MTNFPGLRRTSQRVAAEHLGGEDWRLLRPYTVEWNQYPWGISAKTGFVTDFSSIPKLLRSFIAQRGNQDGPSVMHDLCYRLNLLTRELADELFLLLMELEDVHWLKRQVLYLGVRSGGWVSWNKYRRAENNGRQG